MNAVRRAYEVPFGTVGDQFLGTVGQRDRLRPSRSRHQRRVRARHRAPGRGTPGPGSGSRPTARRDPGVRSAAASHRSRVGHEVLGGADVDPPRAGRPPKKVHGLMTLQGAGQMAVPGDIHGRKSRNASRWFRSAEAPIAPVDLRSSAVVGEFSQSVDEVCPVISRVCSSAVVERPATSRHREIEATGSIACAEPPGTPANASTPPDRPRRPVQERCSPPATSRPSILVPACVPRRRPEHLPRSDISTPPCGTEDGGMPRWNHVRRRSPRSGSRRVGQAAGLEPARCR